ncbi:nucleoside deaminase [Cnuibacter physcomitrellae]|uniref:nucleoside deaminase n=1 Tax=Cnuibacter physcomitrellae TaxID=1619308 RepID=UPI00217574F5|nr:nucleoside deaminase [Cnuibacter physcomitrellae]MCS5495692.1 nucleoside deaminase [Cnuibacter physcomitrellae]
MTELAAQEIAHLERAVALAQAARDRGDHPFGAVVVAVDGAVVEAMNSVVTEHDPTGHAETNAVRASGRRLSDAQLRTATLYTSTEPCAMCAAAIFWAGIPRMVFALSGAALIDQLPAGSDAPSLDLPAREVYARASHPVEAVGPVPLPAAVAVHADFWA